jgi:hypothetical protein
MATKILTGKKYFYALGQSVRSRGLSKDYGTSYYYLDKAEPYALIAFDAGFRGLAI